MLHPLLLMEMMMKKKAMNDLYHRKPRTLLTKEPCTRCPCRLHAPTREENDPALKKAMTEKNERWKSREWYGSTKIKWQQPVGGQSSVDAWNMGNLKESG